MGNRNVTAPHAAAKEELSPQLQQVLSAQNDYFFSGVSRGLQWRKDMMALLVKSVCAPGNAEKIEEAQLKDNVRPFKWVGSTAMFVQAALPYYQGLLEMWASQKSLEDTLPQERRFGVDCEWRKVAEPKGVVLNISPWNAPTVLAILPALGMFAAGNVVTLKPSEQTVHTSQVLEELIKETFGDEYYGKAISVIQGGAKETAALIDSQKFHHIMFTGGPEIGKLVMQRAARYLTPVTLELGGRNPVLIDGPRISRELLESTIKEMVYTKAAFSGQFCQCHNTIYFIDETSDGPHWNAFLDAMGAEISNVRDMTGALARDCKIITEKQWERGFNILQTANAERLLPEVDLKKVETEGRSSQSLPMTAFVNADPSSAASTQELFAPFFNLKRINDIEQAIAEQAELWKSANERPLSSFYYGDLETSQENMMKWVEKTSSGNLVINGGTMRAQSNYNAAIHGVGTSGLGGASLWGEHVFNTFSHFKHVMRPKVNGAFAGSAWAPGATRTGPAEAEAGAAN